MSRFDRWLECVDDEARPLYVIAEIGVNHNGSPEAAAELVRVAAESGADCVKFQVFIAELVASPLAGTVAYQRDATSHDSQLEMIRSLELPTESWSGLRRLAEHYDVDFMATAFDLPSLALVESLDPAAHKIPSGEITTRYFVEDVARQGRPIVMSTGMANIKEVLAAISWCGNAAQVSLMHCVSAYPAPIDAANLLAIPFMRQATGLHTGWSDHTVGDNAGMVSVALGARIFEKHLTLDRTQAGPDHSASADPSDLSSYVESLEAAYRSLGTKAKKPAPGELETASLVRRSWFASRDLPAGHVLTSTDVIGLRPVLGISTEHEVVGSVTQAAIAEGAPIFGTDIATEL